MPLNEALEKGVVVGPELVSRAGAVVGQGLRVGSQVLPIVAVVMLAVHVSQSEMDEFE